MVTGKIKHVAHAVLAVCVAIAFSACSKKSDAPVKTADEVNAEQTAAAAEARKSVVYGNQLKAMDKAKATAEEASKTAAEKLKQADQ